MGFDDSLAVQAEESAGGHLMMRMQLTALGMSSWLSRSKCCGCVPMSLAGLGICAWLMFTGGCALYEGLTNFAFAFRYYDASNHYIFFACCLFIILGCVDVLVGLVSVFAILGRKAYLVLAMVSWLFVRILPAAFVLFIVVVWNTLDVSSGLLVVRRRSRVEPEKRPVRQHRAFAISVRRALSATQSQPKVDGGASRRRPGGGSGLPRHRRRPRGWGASS